MVNKKAVIIVTILAIIIVGIIVIVKVNSLEDVAYTFNEVAKNNENSIEDENTTNKINEENETTNTSNETNTNSSINTNTNNEANTNTSTNVETPTEEDTEDKALELAKKKWGENDDEVYFYIEEAIDDGVFIVSVRNKVTTASMAEYKVDVYNEEVTEN